MEIVLTKTKLHFSDRVRAQATDNVKNEHFFL